MRSVMKHNFSMIPRANIPRSRFNRSHGYKTTFDAGYLVPFYLDEVLPGDTFSLQAAIFSRMATPIVPLMDNLFMETFFFFVPTRLVFDNWQKLNGEQENPGDSTDYLVPELLTPEDTGFTYGTLGDYFSIPTGVPGLPVNSLPFRCYNLIYNEWFRDENLQDSVPVPKDDGPDDPADFQLLRRGKRHDYFTSCLPWPQKGPGVELPLGATANINITDGAVSLPVVPVGSSVAPSFLAAGVNRNLRIQDRNLTPNFSGTAPLDNGTYVAYWGNPNLKAEGTIDNITGVADLTGATAYTINSIREAFQLQKLLERDARGGTRYTEMLRAHFGVISPDSRLQRPEYLGGSSTKININPVEQTSSTDSVTPQGNLAAYGVTADKFHGFTRSFVEHGYIIGLVNVRADLTYQQGLDRLWSRRTRFDFYYPVLSHLGEQAVLNKEIYATGTSSDDEVFGYQERWAEYRYFPSRITGKYRSTDPQPLDIWHLSQKFENVPRLSSEFIEDNPPIDRVIAVPSEPHFLFDSYISLHCARPMPAYSVPGLIDHF